MSKKKDDSWRTDTVNLPKGGQRVVVEFSGAIEVYYNDDLCSWIAPAFTLPEPPKKFRSKP